MNLKDYTREFSYNFKLAYPVILGMIGHTVVGIVDNIMVGKIGATELAAVSLGNSFIFMAMSLGIGFSTALTPLIAETDGKHDTETGRAIFHHGIYLCTILGLFLFGVIYFAKPLLFYMGQSEIVVQLAKPYLDIVGFSLVPLVMFQAYKQFADGLSETKYSMWATIIANVVNVVINYFLIYGIWVFPKMGITGAAIGTTVSRFVMLAYMHYSMKSRPKFSAYFINFDIKNINRAINKKIIGLGFPSAMQMMFEVVLFTAAVWICGLISIPSQAANQIALSMASLTFMFAIGLSVTAMIRVGNQKGKKDFPALRRIAFSIFLLVIILEVVFALLFVVLHADLPKLFVNNANVLQAAENQQVIGIAAQLLLIAAIFQISDGIQVVVLGALRGLQDVKIPMYITFIAYWVIGFPTSFFLGVYTSLGATGVWIGLLSGLTTAALFLYLRFDYLTKKLIQQK